MTALKPLINQYRDSGKLPEALQAPLIRFFISYEAGIKENGQSIEDTRPLLKDYLRFICDQLKEPYAFSYFHEKITTPYDYHSFGLNLIRPLVKIEKSTLKGKEFVREMEKHVARGENVILLANHQTEPDPQAIELLLEKERSSLRDHLTFVAGHRVTTDPLAVPFSKGCNLLCIYSKNYLEHPPEKKREKVLHNQRAMKTLRTMLTEGGKCIYIAPSGGRDRKNENGEIVLKPFDSQSIEMLWFTARHSKTMTHFYPLALKTYDLLPPPSRVNVALGEERITNATPIHLAFGEEIDMGHIPGLIEGNKAHNRQVRAEYAFNAVQALYRS